MKIFLTGKDGQLGSALHKKLIFIGHVTATNRHELNFVDLKAIEMMVDKMRPDLIINAAAYTDVDQAELEFNLAYHVNAAAPKILAEKASEFNIPIIHFSTNYIFDGFKRMPYFESDLPNPISVYGKTKLEGEKRVSQYEKHIILRTGWLFSDYGENFLNTILKCLEENSTLKIVNDQYGSPTSIDLLAEATLKVIKILLNNPNFNNFGTYHISSKGEVNCYEYASFILETLIRLKSKSNLLMKNILPVKSTEYSKKIIRPLYSVLDTQKIQKTFDLDLPCWKNEVERIMSRMFH